MNLFLKTLVEFIGTFIFLSVIIATISLPANNFNGPFTGAFALLAAIFFGARVSGAHFNPAVTFMMLLREQIGAFDGLIYVIAQLFGATAAFAMDALVLSSK